MADVETSKFIQLAFNIKAGLDSNNISLKFLQSTPAEAVSEMVRGFNAGGKQVTDEEIKQALSIFSQEVQLKS